MPTFAPIPPKSPTALRVLHTSDWHIGKRLFNQTRYDEFEAFLTWLITVIDRHKIDVLLVAGDVFDTMTPSNKAQELYYDFLGLVAKSHCEHIIITAGNHDSPTFLDAPKALLKSLNVQVIGQATDDPTDEVIVLKQDDDTLAIVLAVPYLRDKDIRASGSFDDSSQKLTQTNDGIAKHYRTLSEYAKALQADCTKATPIIATGHLFAAGASVSSEDDGMRKETVVGTLGQLDASVFDESIDYVALGHIHAPQTVANQDRIRYCGSPIAMGFGEAGKIKQVLIADFDPKTPTIYSLAVPIFVPLVRIKGDFDTISNKLNQLIAQDQKTYAEIEYTGDTLMPQLASLIRQMLEHTPITALNIINKSQYQHILKATHQGESLKELSELDVFKKRLERAELDSGHEALIHAYQAVLHAIHDSDDNAL
ncbi:exonuclease SbcCD subunit D C-terminal domain-containing protein [Moraxella nasovis]|uniref:exonuclease SbcCD subunit D C-terminal domain-containing protein n=1 Tax=Moraxella nasovis TaxID=2904121 RepID=UPI001F61ED93|nr:exonuclease SbcCD subunit D C-terminal domain-containing protein [Moraxella nasovis]UNU73598.1 exonuclease SbcCD subunit D C-terminal domain-containing protein [Moraxella nasovis]